MRKNKGIFNKIYYDRLNYINDVFVYEDSLLRNIKNECLLNNRPITISSEEGNFLQFLIYSYNINNIIEIGTLFGYSTVWLVRGLGKDGHIWTIEKEEYNKKIAERNFNHLENNLKDKITLLYGPALDELKKLIDLELKVDMIFIDGDKNNYLNYLHLSEKLVKKNGLIVADNTFLSGAVYLDYLPNRIRSSTQNVMREFNKELSNKDKYFSTMLNTEEGLTLAIKKF